MKRQKRPTKDEIHDAAVILGRRGGRKGGLVTAERLSGEERSENARHAANERWRQQREREGL